MTTTVQKAPAPVVQHRSARPLQFRLRRFRNWFFLGLLYGGFYLCRYNLGIVGPEMMRDVHLNTEEFGRISTSRDIGYAFGQFVNGLFADGLGGKQSMALGALGTIGLNLLFGFTSKSSIAWMLTAFILIRLLDGYIQAFGSPGMMKVKTAWFEKKERGGFSGIFGLMIQLGHIGANALGKLLIVGFTVPLVGLTVAALHWRAMFFVPPVILAVLLVLAWLNVKNHPEEVGYTIDHEPEIDGDASPDRPPLRHVFLTIVRTPLAWINAGAYFCTGFVRQAVNFWWVTYLAQAWGAGKDSPQYGWLMYLVPGSAIVGSIVSGYVSDLVFGGRRSPVGVLLYSFETVAILSALAVLGYTSLAGPVTACVFLVLIAFTCNASHSVIGAAVVMDIGGRKMSGFTSGLIDCFQYLGSALAGWKLGSLIMQHGWNAYFAAMLPFSALGALLMLGVWLKTRGRDVRGS